MTIHIEDLSFDVIIGILDFERSKTQKIIVNLELTYPYDNNQFINYADIVSLIKNELRTRAYTLLEDALLGLKDLLQKNYPELQNLWLKISKPNIMPECTVSLSQSWNFS